MGIRYANVLHLKRIINFMKENDKPFTKTDLGRATNTLPVIDSALKFMVNQDWVEYEMENSTKYYFLSGGEFSTEVD